MLRRYYDGAPRALTLDEVVADRRRKRLFDVYDQLRTLAYPHGEHQPSSCEPEVLDAFESLKALINDRLLKD